MKFKFYKNLIISFMLVCGMQANAGLITGGNEWLELDITSGKSKLYVETNILTQSQYKDYEYATATQVNELYLSMTVGVFNALDNQGGWMQLNGLTAQQKQVYDWFAGGYSQNRSFGFTGVTTSKYNRGYINVRSPNTTGAFWVGHIDLMYNTVNGVNTDRGHNDRPIGDNISLANTAGITRNTKTEDQVWMQHALVKKTDVPEPTTLAIFALGMIGLASRRFKKQS
ncbi:MULTISPECIES: PEP-CTERM sorting domain-containing protein [unclassified Colwellia]|uniref:PEP-CTERM sorting domain-containing protein n=1 Tax=unclassified Colwellia TaxID=196834 RepID=UPI002174F42E|nr:MULTISPECIES: PEP-CTERM sorting domain-containing protein [unclassified Colwellia]